MTILLAFALLQAAAPAPSAPTIDLTCTGTATGSSTKVALTFHIAKRDGSFTGTRNGGPAFTGTAGETNQGWVLGKANPEDPNEQTMYFVHTTDNTYIEALRQGASAMTNQSDGTCKSAAAK